MVDFQRDMRAVELHPLKSSAFPAHYFANHAETRSYNAYGRLHG
jgi:hypothetical protein